MRRHVFISSLLIGLTPLLFAISGGAGESIHYPETRQVDHTDTYHGTTVADPYRWLEADVRQSEEVRRWVEAENRLTARYLEAIPERKALQQRLTEVWNFPRQSVPLKGGNRYFFLRNDGLQNLEVLYTQRSLAEEPQVLIDPNEWSPDGTVNLGNYEPSPDGRYLVYGISEGGSDWRTYHVMEIATRTVLPEEIRWSKGCCVSWTADSRGFFYSRFPEPAKGTEYQGANRDQALYYHRIGTPAAADVLAFSVPDHPEWRFSAQATEDGRYLVVGLTDRGRQFRFLVRDLAEPYGTFRVLLDDFPNRSWVPVGNEGPVIFFHTDFEAPRGRILAIDVDRPQREHWREIVPQSEDSLRFANLVGNLLAVNYLRDAVPSIRLFTLDGKHLRDVELPGIGASRGATGSRQDSEMFYGFASFNRPATIYRYDPLTGESRIFFQPKVPFDSERFEVKQVFYRSKDGTRIPMFLGHRKGLRLDGDNPTLLTGYGGFNISMSASFNAAYIPWMEQGGVVALACLRGGGEYGEEWHEAGMKLRKQNVFDDFIAGAEWLIANRYTRPARLAIQGGSNGGLLVGAAMTQRPDLFGAAIPRVGVMDMLRYHLFTVGSFWVQDYGTPDDPETFKALHAYSPYHNLKDGTRYPPTLVMTGDTDDRVVPGHSFKFAARLQRAQAGEAPVLLRIAAKAGHGGADATRAEIEEEAEVMAFLMRNLGMAWKPVERAAAP
jgi:prolyl oligopeptidase